MQAPLSNAISVLVAAQTSENWNEFFATLLGSRLGVIATGLPPGATGAIQAKRNQISLGRTTRNGVVLLLACADFGLFRARFPEQGFNAEMDAHSLFRTALYDPGCEGILVNSAVSAHSVPVARAKIVELVSRASS